MALAARVPEPGDSDPVTRAEPGHTLPDLDHGADHLVAGHHRGAVLRKVAFRHMKIGAAHPTDMHLDEEAAGRRVRNRALDQAHLPRPLSAGLPYPHRGPHRTTATGHCA